MDGNKFVHICQPRLDEPTLCSNIAYVHDELKHLTPEPTSYLGYLGINTWSHDGVSVQ